MSYTLGQVRRIKSVSRGLAPSSGWHLPFRMFFQEEPASTRAVLRVIELWSCAARPVAVLVPVFLYWSDTSNTVGLRWTLSTYPHLRSLR